MWNTVEPRHLRRGGRQREGGWERPNRVIPRGAGVGRGRGGKWVHARARARTDDDA